MKNADQARDESMEEILASIRKIIADDEASGATPLDPRAPIHAPMMLEPESLEAALAREPMFDMKEPSPGPAPQPLGAPSRTSSIDADILDLSEDFLIAEGEFDNPFLTPTPFESGLRAAPARAEAAAYMQRTNQYEAPADPQNGNIQSDALEPGERRLWDGQPPIALRAAKPQGFHSPAQPSLAPQPSARPTLSATSPSPDARPKETPGQSPARAPSRPNWSGARDLGRDTSPASAGAEKGRPAGGAGSGLSLDGIAGEPFWPHPERETATMQPEPAPLRAQSQRLDQAPPKNVPLRATQPSQAARVEPPHLASRLSSPVTQNGSTPGSMPQLPELGANGPVSEAPDMDGGSRPQYFQAMAEELARATIGGLGDRELAKASEKKIGAANRPALAAVTESFADALSSEAFQMSARDLPQAAPSQRMPSHIAPTERPAARAVEPAAVAHLQPTQKSLEDGFKDLLKPMLMDWLNENMPRLLEGAVQDEMKRRLGPKQD